MTTSTRIRGNSAAAEREHHRTNLWAQVARFIGLFLSPMLGLIVSWMIHVWVTGVRFEWGPIDVDRRTPWFVPWIAGLLVIAATAGLAWLAWHMVEHRKVILRYALAGSVAAVGLLFGVNIATGPSYWWSGLFVIVGWSVAVVWSINRLDVARNDKSTDEPSEDTLLEKWGINRATRFVSKIFHDEETGEPVRAEIRTKHAPGETVEVFTDNLGSIESAAGGPPNMSTAIVDPDRADQSTLTVMLKDPFKRNLKVGPLTAPGGSIADYASVADYADGKPAFVTTAAGKHMASSTSYGLIGMTRAGKTGTETQLLTEWGSRIDWTCLYLNQAKGLQDIRPLLPIIEAAVIAENGEAGLGAYTVTVGHVKNNIMIYRQSELARFGVSAWSPRCADPNPDRRPSRLGANGVRIVMERMPFLTAHFGEADSILASGRAADDAVFVASKGLSLGVNTGWSLQRPDWKSMPTGLRANIGLWFVHGLNNTDEEDFILDEDVRKAGAHPGKWGQRKPGQHFMTGPGIDESRFPVALKTRFLVGSATDENGRPIDFDTLNDRYTAEMLRRNKESAPKMCKLDRGSAESTDGWWDEQVAKTVELRDRMLNPETATASANTRTATSTATAIPVRSPLAGKPRPQPQVDDDDEMTDEEREEAMAEFAADVEDQAGEVADELYDGDDRERAETHAMDLTRPADRPEVDVDPLADGDDDDEKPAAVSREEARAEVRRTLIRMLGMQKYADRKVPGTAIVGPSDVLGECNLRSRPWVSGYLAELMMDGGGVEDGVVMERHGKPIRGQYRLRRTDGSDHRE